MGFSLYFRSTEAITPPQAATIIATAGQLIEGRTWLSCEPLILRLDEDQHLWSGTKPTFEPADIDIADARQQDLPDGTISDVIEILCQLSRDHGVDWEVSHDFEELGMIRKGVADPAITQVTDTLTEMCGMLGEFDPEKLMEGADDFDDDEPPDILRFPG